MSSQVSTISPSPAVPALYLREAQMAAQRGEVPSLDGMRAGSIIIVLCSHILNDKLFPGGFGVLFFFAISGFLITRLLLSEYKLTAAINLKNFYIRRFLRLYPVIIAYIIFISIVSIVKNLPYSWNEVFSVLFYYTNYLFAYTPNANEHSTLPVAIFWSLAIEEHFYLIFPPLLVLLRARPLVLAGSMLFVILLALSIRLVVAHYHPEYLSTHYFYRRTETRMDSLATGVLIAVLCELPRGRRLLQSFSAPWALLGALLLTGACLLIRDAWFRETFRYSILNCCVAVIMSAVLFSNRYPLVNVVLNLPAVVWIGRLSYSLYVWHFSLFYTTGSAAIPYEIRVPLLFALTVVFAIASYFLVEQPVLALKRRFGSARREPPANAL